MTVLFGIGLMLVFINQIGADLFETRPPGLFPDDYNKDEPPWKNGKPVHVYLRLIVMDVDKIDDGNMEFSIQTYLLEYWNDARLNLSTIFDLHRDIEHIFPTYLTAHIWMPDLVFDNTKDGKLFHLAQPNTIVKVKKDGSFVRSTRYNLLVGCQMDFQFYPMDTQKCYIKIATMSSPDYKVLLKWLEEYSSTTAMSIQLMNDIQPLMYVLREPKTHKCTEVWPSGSFTFLYANFTFQRRLSGSIFNVYVPSTLVVFLSWISFWIDINAVPARITLGVTSLLTLATQRVQAHSGLPRINYMTAMDLWLLVCLLSVFCSLMEFAFSYQIFILSQKSVQKPEEEMRQRSRLVQNLSVRRTHCSRKIFAASGKSQGIINSKISLDKISRTLFPLLFIVFAISYWSYYLYRK